MSEAWGLRADAPRRRHGFLLNHLIAESVRRAWRTALELDPITGQAAWYDLRVRVLRKRPARPACGQNRGMRGARR